MFKRFQLSAVLFILFYLLTAVNSMAAVTYTVPFAQQADWVNVMWYNASGSSTATTISGTCTAPATSCTLTSSATFAVNQGIAIAGAGAAGVEYVGKITAVNGNVVTITPATSTTVVGTAVNHDDTQAIIDAVASGKHVYLPKGTYNVTSAITLSANGSIGQIIAGVSNNYWGIISKVVHRSATTNVFVLGTTKAHLKDLSIFQDAGITPTAGAGVVVGNGTTAIYGPTVEGVYINGTYDGMEFVDLTILADVSQTWIQSVKRYGVNYHTSEPYGSNWFTHMLINSSTTATAGFYIARGDEVHVALSYISQFPTAVLLKPNALVALQRVSFTDVFIEDYTAYGIDFDNTTGSTTFRNNIFTNVELTPQANAVTNIIIRQASIKDTSFTNMINWGGTNGTGLNDGGTGTKVIGSRFGYGLTTGITFAASAVNSVIMGNTFVNDGATQTGVTCTAGASYITLVGNNLRGVTTPMNANCNTITGLSTTNNLGLNDKTASGYGNFTGAVGGCTINTSLNVASCTRNALGDYTVTFNSPFATTNFTCTVTPEGGNIVSYTSRTTTTVRFVVKNTGGTAVDDAFNLNCVGY